MARQPFEDYEIKRRFALERQLLAMKLAYELEEDLIDFLHEKRDSLPPGAEVSVDEVYREWRAETAQARLTRFSRKALQAENST